MKYDDNDEQYQEHKLKSVDACKGGWTVTTTEGWSLFVTDEHEKVAPLPGEVARYYGQGVGYSVRGVVIEGRTYRYLSQKEAEDEAESRARESEREDREKSIAGRAEFDARVARLPEPLRLRMEGFLATGEAWGPKCGNYELFCCEQAALIAEAMKTGEAVKEFHKADYKRQRELVPGLDDGHSGNTFGTACMLAHALIEAPGNVPAYHGALCPLLGCEGAGCMAGRPKVEGAAEGTPS